MCMLSVCTFLKVVGYYDFSILSMSVMSFQKKKFGWRWVGEVNSIQFILDFSHFLTLQSPYVRMGTEDLGETDITTSQWGPGRRR